MLQVTNFMTSLAWMLFQVTRTLHEKPLLVFFNKYTVVFAKQVCHVLKFYNLYNWRTGEEIEKFEIWAYKCRKSLINENVISEWKNQTGRTQEKINKHTECLKRNRKQMIKNEKEVGC